MGAIYNVCIGWYTNFILGIHIYLLAIAICGIIGCYGHLVTMLCLLSNPKVKIKDKGHLIKYGGEGPVQQNLFT